MSQEKTKVTIYDVADKAGVAISTVSRVLNNSTDVSDRTRKRVLQAIDELQFRPDRTAKALAQQKTHSLAIAIPTFTTPFHNELLKGIRSCLRDHNYDFLLYDLGSRSPQQKLLSFLKRGAVDGLLLSGVPMTEKLSQELDTLQAPVVLIGTQRPTYDSFYWDDIAGAKQAVNHLLSQGHRRIGMIRAYTESELQAGRVLGYKDALEHAGIPYDSNLVQSGETKKHAGFSEEDGYDAMEQLLTIDPPITAVFASSDVQAVGAWKAIIDAGRKVPDDIALVGYDDVKNSHYIGLSSVDQSMQKIGHRATEVLIGRKEKTLLDPPISELVTPQLQIRRSSVKR